MTDHTIEIFSRRTVRHPRKQWWWRLRAANGRIVAHSAEGYVNRSHCEEMVLGMPLRFTGARLEYEEGK